MYKYIFVDLDWSRKLKGIEVLYTMVRICRHKDKYP